MMNRTGATEDHRAAVAAFVAKEKPVFHGASAGGGGRHLVQGPAVRRPGASEDRQHLARGESTWRIRPLAGAGARRTRR